MFAYPGLLRLKKEDEFSSVFNLCRTKSGFFLKAYYHPNQLTHSRLGLVVSKKVHKRANKRNYMKRVIRELFRQKQNTWVGHDIVVRVQRAFTHADYLKIQMDFDTFSSKICK